MSLDCYPFGRRQTIGLCEQPMAVDVAYDNNLLITVIDNCQTVVAYDLNRSRSARVTSDRSDEDNNLVGKFSLDKNVVIDKVVYCTTGDYIACVGDKNGTVTLYTVFNWRLPATKASDNDAPPGNNETLQIEELSLDCLEAPFDDVDRRDKLNSISMCQRTGNLAASYGDLVVIYRFKDRKRSSSTIDGSGDDEVDDKQIYHNGDSSGGQHADDVTSNSLHKQPKHFKHIISVKLTMWAVEVALVENYLSIMTVDHVQVLKLELLTLQIQSDGLDDDSSASLYLQATNGQVANQSSSGSSNGNGGGDSDSHQQGRSSSKRRQSCPVVGIAANGTTAGSSNDATSTSTTIGTTESTSCDTGSMMSNSNDSTTTNFSAFNTTASTLTGNCPSTACGNATNGSTLRTSDTLSEDGGDQLNNDSDMSIITMNNQQVIECPADLMACSNDDCITWNLNTKKLVKLPTLMHNTSSDLSSYHIFHPLELLGPASESIACRVNARLYSADFCQNQLEPVVMLCKQFDFGRDPVKSTHLQAIYLSSLDDQKRLSGRSTLGAGEASQASTCNSNVNNNNNINNNNNNSGNSHSNYNSSEMMQTTSSTNQFWLKSLDHELLASVTCFVATLTNCFVYSLHGKKVTRIQTITNPDLCLDLRPDLLNVYLLTPLGLQICSTGLCDSTFRYDWSSSADLNLLFVACNRARVLTTADHIIMISTSSSLEQANTNTGATMTNTARNAVNASLTKARRPIQGDSESPPEAEEALAGGDDESCCFIEYMEKPSLADLFARIVHIINRCQSISIRSNLLTYLHASAQLALISNQAKMFAAAVSGDDTYQQDGQQQDTIEGAAKRVGESISMLKTTAVMLCKQLLQKKQMNVITNGRIDKVIKHLLDISYCDLGELMSRHLAHIEQLEDQEEEVKRRAGRRRTTIGQSNESRLGQSQDIVYDNSCNSADGFNDDDDDDDDAEQPVDSDYELLRIYLKYTKYNQSILDYLQANSGDEQIRTRLVSYMFDNNPRLLIKCAQRLTNEFNKSGTSNGNLDYYSDPSRKLDQKLCLELFVDKLKQLAEFDSTGINRATVLFTLAILSDAKGDQQQCLATMNQIKPLNHLAITMCSNYEIIDKSLAKLVEENYPEVFKLFVNQLARQTARSGTRLLAEK